MSGTGVDMDAAREGEFLAGHGKGVVTVAAVALGLSIFLLIFGEGEGPAVSAGADSFSRSAVGYHALGEFLERSGVTMVITRYRPLEALGPEAGLALFEPPTDSEGLERVRTLVSGALERGAPVVVVLPERAWAVDPTEAGRVSDVRPLLPTRLSRLLAAVAWPQDDAPEGGAVPLPARPDLGLETQVWEGPLAAGAEVTLVEPQVLPVDALEMTAEIYAGGDGVVFRDRERGLTLVTDPDLLNTHGIGRGDNALVAKRLFLGTEGGAEVPQVWVVDETLHGYERAPSVVGRLLEFPLSLFTVQVALLAVVVVWSAARRFGRPLPAPPRVPGGTSTLLETTARLLEVGGHHGETLERYLEAALDRASERLASRPIEGADRVSRLAAVARSRGVTEDLEDIARRVAALSGQLDVRDVDDGGVRGEAFILAHRVHRWCEEVLDGAR